MAVGSRHLDGGSRTGWHGVGAERSHKRVLVLDSTRRDAEFSTISEGELPRTLDIGLGRSLDYYSELIDSARFPQPAYQGAFGDFLRLKYQGVRFDLVIATGTWRSGSSASIPHGSRTRADQHGRTSGGLWRKFPRSLRARRGDAARGESTTARRGRQGHSRGLSERLATFHLVTLAR
jgi:hypothetical protein